MSVSVKIACPHAVTVTLDGDPGHIHIFDETVWRRFVRDTLLACPRCWQEATAFIEDPGT